MDAFEKCVTHFQQCKAFGALDLVVLPVFSLVITFFAYRIRNNLAQGNPIYKRYYIRALSYKMIGAVMAGIIYQFYYTCGDTVFYWGGASALYEFIIYDFGTYLKFLDYSPSTSYPELSTSSICALYFNDPKAWTVIRVASIFNFIAFDTYMGTALFFGIVSFYSSWRLFTLLCALYPDLEKKFFYAIFMIPSVLFWGSGIFKDTLTLSGLLLMVCCAYEFFILGKRNLSSLVLLVLCF